ncbi:MAG: Spy/CpxP family protein refolding chaperone [Flavobacteriales bacterium]|nr:Spy/CpxP family protein refolding chaperone [Flavobacteriales bacterium]
MSVIKACSHIRLLIHWPVKLGHEMIVPILRSWLGSCLGRIIHPKQTTMKKHIGILGLSVLIAFPALAQDRQSQKAESQGQEQDAEREGRRFLDLPGISEAQLTQLKGIFQEVKKANKPRHEDMKAMREKLRALKGSENPNLGEINGLIDRINGLRAEMEKTRTAGELKAMSILTPAQQEVLRAKMKEHVKHKREHKVEQRKLQEPIEKK